MRGHKAKWSHKGASTCRTRVVSCHPVEMRIFFLESGSQEQYNVKPTRDNFIRESGSLNPFHLMNMNSHMKSFILVSSCASKGTQSIHRISLPGIVREMFEPRYTSMSRCTRTPLCKDSANRLPPTCLLFPVKYDTLENKDGFTSFYLIFFLQNIHLNKIIYKSEIIDFQKSVREMNDKRSSRIRDLHLLINLFFTVSVSQTRLESLLNLSTISTPTLVSISPDSPMILSTLSLHSSYQFSVRLLIPPTPSHLPSL